jgi:hypothetical protein
VAIDRSRELVYSENVDLLQAFIEGRVFDKDRGLMAVVTVVEQDSLFGCR